MEGTSMGFIGGVRNGPWYRIEGLALLRPARQRSQKSHGVGMARIAENMLHASDLRDSTGVHNIDSIRNLGNDSEVVGYVEKGHMPLFLEFPEEVEYLILNGYIKGRRRFIGNDEVGFASKGHSDHDALPLPSAEVMRVIVHTLFRRCDFHIGEKFNRSPVCFLLPDGLMGSDSLLDLISDGEDRIEGGHGFLEDHGDLSASDTSKGLFIEVQEISSLEENLSIRNLSRRLRDEPQDGESRNGLTTAGLADDAHRFTPLDLVTHSVYSPRDLTIAVEIDP